MAGLAIRGSRTTGAPLHGPRRRLSPIVFGVVKGSGKNPENVLKLARGRRLCVTRERVLPTLTRDIMRFGSFALHRGRGQLIGENGPIALRPKSFALLCHFVEQAGRLLAKGRSRDV